MPIENALAFFNPPVCPVPGETGVLDYDRQSQADPLRSMVTYSSRGINQSQCGYLSDLSIGLGFLAIVLMILNLLVFLLQKKSDGIKRQDINDELLQLRNDVGVLKDDVDNLENALGSLGGHVSTLEDGVGNLKANTCYFDSRFHRLEQSHASMENCLEKVENTRVNFRR